jgi:Holliday junction resolvasome RuvABC endonuclease subunit
MGMGWGILSAVSCVKDLPVLQARPQEIKEANAGKKSASKEQVRAAVTKRYPEASRQIAYIKPPSLQEHAYDAISAGVACLNSTEVATLRRIAS